MGNFQQKLASTKPIEQYSSTIKNIEDSRSQSEVQLTDRLVEAFTFLNTERIMSQPDVRASSLNWDQYVTVYFHGIPSVAGQFDYLDIPGEQVHYTGISFGSDFITLSQEQKLKRFKASMFETEADNIHNLLSQIKQTKKLIFVYHSFGNFLMSAYFNVYGNSIFYRVKGMIDIAGAPLTMYTTSRMFTPIIIETSEDQLLKQSDKIHKIFQKIIKSTGFPIKFVDKYQTLSFMNYFKSKTFGMVFKNTENHPKVLKLIAHGSNDVLFETKLLNKKAVFFSYQRQLDQAYSDKKAIKYEELYHPKIMPKNIQQRFIFNVPKGVHSVHMQKQNNQLLRLAVQHYLCVIHE